MTSDPGDIPRTPRTPLKPLRLVTPSGPGVTTPPTLFLRCLPHLLHHGEHIHTTRRFGTIGGYDLDDGGWTSGYWSSLTVVLLHARSYRHARTRVTNILCRPVVAHTARTLGGSVFPFVVVTVPTPHITADERTTLVLRQC